MFNNVYNGHSQITDQHPITPPPGLRQLWAQQAQRMNPRDPIAWQEHIADQAAQWGANKELDACCKWFVRDWTDIETADKLRTARRPPVIPEIIEVDGYTYRLVK